MIRGHVHGRHPARVLCAFLRIYSTTIGWILTCAALAAGLASAVTILIPILALQFAYVVHVGWAMKQQRTARDSARPPR